MESELPPLTEFQKTIIATIERYGLNRQMQRRSIAEVGFPERWRKKSARAAMVGHIDRAVLKMPDFCGRLDAKQQHEEPMIFLK